MKQKSRASSLSRWVSLAFFVAPFLGSVSACAQDKSSSSLPLRYFVPALKLLDEEAFLGKSVTSGIRSDRLMSGLPVIPVHPWALRFTEDFLVSLQNDGPWAMVEITRIPDPAGDLWFVLDSMWDGKQYVGLPQDPRAKSTAAAFPAPSYFADLHVTRTEANGQIHIAASYQRIDGKKVEVSFSVSSESRPHSTRQRNGHAMNHSESRTLALLDLAEFRFASGPIQFSETAVKPQKILGFPVAGLLSQTVGGIQTEQTSQHSSRLTSLSLDGNRRIAVLHSVPQSDGGVTVIEKPEFSLTRTEFHFESPDPATGLKELRSIQVLPEHEFSQGKEPLFEITFNPSLPDLRVFPAHEKWEGRYTIRVQNQRPYGQGQLRIFRQGPEAEVEILWLPQYPEWNTERPVLSRIKLSEEGGAQTHHQVLTPGAPRIHETAPTPAVPIQLDLARTDETFLIGLDFVWKKRPHRLSRLSCLMGNSLTSHLALGGGTWANGESATDTADLHVLLGNWKRTDLSRGPVFGRVPELPVLPLLQSRREDSSTRHSVEVSGRQDFELRWDAAVLPPGYRNSTPLIWLRGFSLEPGPAHESTGLTPMGLQWNTEVLEASPGWARVRITVNHQAGTVPDRRQNLEDFSAFARTQLGIAFLPDGEKPPQIGRKIENFETPFQILHEPEGPFGFETGIHATPMALQLWKGFSWSLMSANAQNPGRYLREIRLQTQMTPGHSRFSNAGEWTRATQGQVGVESFDFHFLPQGSEVTLDGSIEAASPLTR